MTNENELKSISEILERIVESSIGETLKDYAEDLEDSSDDISGLETEMTGSLRTKINETLLDSIEKEFNDKLIGRYKFKVQTFKGKSQEPFVGADILGKLEIQIGGQNLFKYFLAQSKIAKTRKEGFAFGDANLLSQASQMLYHTPDSFFFLYHKTGIKVVSAFMVNLLAKATLNTSSVGHKSFGEFYSDHFNCFIGDNRHWFIKVHPEILPSDFVKYVIDIKISNAE